jgi:hypothetical protein
MIFSMVARMVGVCSRESGVAPSSTPATVPSGRMVAMSEMWIVQLLVGIDREGFPIRTRGVLGGLCFGCSKRETRTSLSDDLTHLSRHKHVT